MKSLITTITLLLSLNAFSMMEEENFAVKSFNEKCQTEFTRDDITYNEELDSDYDYFSLVIGFKNEGQVYMTIMRNEVRGEYDDDDTGNNGYSEYKYYVDEIYCTGENN